MLSVLPALSITPVPALTLSGQIGESYSLEYISTVGPTNAWVPLAALTFTNVQEIYCDVTAIGQQARFYRLRKLP